MGARSPVRRGDGLASYWQEEYPGEDGARDFIFQATDPTLVKAIREAKFRQIAAGVFTPFATFRVPSRRLDEARSLAGFFGKSQTPSETKCLT